MRAGDSDRAAVVDLLRAHHLDGRLTVEEFEQRIERAHGAVTLLELGDLHDDLPELQPRRGKIVRRDTRAPRIPGLLLFVERVELRADPQAARREAALARHGYKLAVDDAAMAFHRRRRPAWTILVAIFAFPIGLIALVHTELDEIVIEIGPSTAGGTALLIHGTGSLAVRRAFAQLRD
jgi:hypothetical protein